MPISKLAAFMEIDERVLKTHLLAFKHKMKNVVWTKGSGSSGLEGELQSSSEVHGGGFEVGCEDSFYG